MKLNRREFISRSSFALGGLLAAPHAEVMTVTGRMKAADLGPTLMHEHVLVDFIGADKINRGRYVAREVFETALPHLKRVHSAGCRTFVECTPNWLGRDVALLQRLSRSSGLRIITNTGLYGARQHQFLPATIRQQTAEQIASDWIREFERGIDETKVKPGIIKIGVDAGPLSELNQKIVTSAALTHLKTGLTIAAHTGNGAAAMQEIDLIERNGVDPQAFIWVHAQGEKDTQMHIEVARRGGWIEFDGISVTSIERHVELVSSMRGAGLLDHVLISQDSGWYHVGEPAGGSFRGYDTLFTHFVPALKAAGFSAIEIDQLLIGNPQKALELKIRSRKR